MDPDMDTDTLIAITESLLNATHTREDILNALIRFEGDSDAAAQLLNLESQTGPSRQNLTTGKKRKRGDLDAWLKPQTAAKKRQGTPRRSSEPEASTSRLVLRSEAPSPRRETRPATDLMSVLRQPPKIEKPILKLPPLTLSTPKMVAEHTPCTLHPSILPPELATKLFYSMIDASQQWKRNKWWLFDRVVESPHKTSFFARRTNGLNEDASWQEAARFWYNGRMTDVPPVFPPEMEEACRIVERAVNAEMSKRTRHALEWVDPDGKPSWRSNVAASNCYEGGKESVGWHSDQLTYLGPYATIVSQK
ncbi:unnamed protein product [Mycena citricolor]|uniref:Alpha-ketoglutarate-dependent dioxygenase AlkB-like domain-containing protein n=1 Tax=Mycena citricolor TaxID=2018698 RepID=A0AAD2GV83_9AGAR|nr:unnamed protein product [Mycena citricolor]